MECISAGNVWFKTRRLEAQPVGNPRRNLCATQAEEKLDPATVEFFENKIRPVLAETCCHSQKSEKVSISLVRVR